MNVNIVLADYSDLHHQQAIKSLMAHYAADPMGGDQVLATALIETLPDKLSALPYAMSLICYTDEQPVGLMNCFESFSTFVGKPLINIHDFVVLKAYRGQGISQLMLTKLQEIAHNKGYCKITLEVLDNNTAAKAAYKKFGFGAYELLPENGSALFWQKHIS